jgi:glycolate oxidase FAD binding subunit
MTQADALLQLDRWGGEPLPLRASLWHEGRLVVQLAGARAAVDAARGALGGEELGTAAGDLLWQQARDQDHAYFAAALRTLGEAVPGEPPPVLWRIAVPAARPPLALAGSVLVEWGGGQRWVLSREPAARVRTLAAALGGHATAFRRPAALPDPCRGAVFTAPGAALERIHRELKRAFDPARIFNRGRLYPWL